MANRRRIILHGTENTRDLGGYPAKNGHTTKYKAFLRSDIPGELSAEDEQIIKDMNITTIIDLRSHDEIERTPCYFADKPDFHYHHFHLFGHTIFVNGEDNVGEGYMGTLKTENLPHIFRSIANAPAGVLYHCTAGKDRTGIVSAILLLLAGVEKEDIIADYIITYPYLARRLLIEIKEHYPDFPAYMGYSNYEYMDTFLTLFAEEFGTAENYLKSIGLTAEEISTIENKLI